MTLYEVTMMCIEQESELKELNALSERIDVMFLIGEKFETNEYIELADAVSKKISAIETPDSPTEEETPADSESETKTT